MADDKNLRPVFFVGDAADGAPFLMIGLPEAAYADLVARPGIAKDIDLTNVGIQFRVSIFACKDRDDGIATMKAIADALQLPFEIDMNKDFSIKDRRN